MPRIALLDATPAGAAGSGHQKWCQSETPGGRPLGNADVTWNFPEAFVGKYSVYCGFGTMMPPLNGALTAVSPTNSAASVFGRASCRCRRYPSPPPSEPSPIRRAGPVEPTTVSRPPTWASDQFQPSLETSSTQIAPALSI